MLTKEMVKNQIDKLPDEFSVDQLFERLILVDKIEKGIKDSKEGNIISYEEMGEKIKAWKLR